MRFISAVAAALSLCALPAAAEAATFVLTDDPTVFIDEAGGPLVSASVHILFEVTGEVEYASPEGLSNSVDASLSASLDTPFGSDYAALFPAIPTTFDSVDDFPVTDGQIITLATVGSANFTITDADLLADMEGGFSFAPDYTVALAAILNQGGTGMLLRSQTVTVTYNFEYVFAPSAVPEPATWAMMVAGFGLAGGALRRSRRAQAPA